jgi:glycogen operon protein
LIQRRLARDMAEEPGVESLAQLLRESNKSWHGVKLNQPDWSHSSHSIVLTAEILKNRLFIHWILNAWREALDFELPSDCGQWNRWIDTGLESPEDIVTWEDVRPVLGTSYLAAPHSVVVLFSAAPKQTPSPTSVLS